jgi:hypothetical protein
MFQMTHEVESRLVAAACDQLGWHGDVVGPVFFGGVRFWASISIDSREHTRRRSQGLGAIADRGVLERELRTHLETRARPERHRLRPPLRLMGCLILGSGSSATAQASLFAGYSPRAVLVPDRGDVLGVLVEAALLDQGVVLRSGDGIDALSEAGPRVAGGRFDVREWELLETLYQSYLAATLVMESER